MLADLTRWLDNDTHFLWAIILAPLVAGLIGGALAFAFARKTEPEGDLR